ncbi:hypothetical protein MRX96_007379 [Rhipicephalus microplus]
MAPATVFSTTGSGDVDSNSLLADDNNWLLRLFVNLLGYATIIGPGALVVCYVRRSKFLENRGGPFARVLRLFVLGHEPDTKPSLELGGSSEPQRPPNRSLLSEAFVLAYCFLGLQVRESVSTLDELLNVNPCEQL